MIYDGRLLIDERLLIYEKLLIDDILDPEEENQHECTCVDSGESAPPHSQRRDSTTM